MILNNLRMIGTDDPVNVQVRDGKIARLSTSVLKNIENAPEISFAEAIVFPGLINSHDHLDFNLFPQLGSGIYNNYTEWGNDIHKNYKEEIEKVLKIPASLRSRWGVFKNLLCGVTTVVNHGIKSGLKNDPITVFEKCQCVHSVAFEKKWKIKLNNPLKIKLPAVIHVGEGSDYSSFREIDQLIRWNLFKKKLIGIHAVAMLEDQAEKFEAIIWCPDSNYFLLNKTAPVNFLQNQTNILFGTDSTLTSGWDIWSHLLLARKTGLLSDRALYLTLNQNAAKTWQLNCGKLAPGKDADLVAARLKQGKTGYDAFFGLKPADLLLVIHQGEIRLFDETLLAQLAAVDIGNFSRIYIQGACKYVQGNLPGLMEKIGEYYPGIKFPVSLCKPG